MTLAHKLIWIIHWRKRTAISCPFAFFFVFLRAEVFCSLETLQQPTKNNILFMSLLEWVPEWMVHRLFKSAPSERLKHVRHTGKLSDSVARHLLKEKHEALFQRESNHDVMSLIVKANASEDPQLRMTETDMIAQLRYNSLFLLSK